MKQREAEDDVNWEQTGSNNQNMLAKYTHLQNLIFEVNALIQVKPSSNSLPICFQCVFSVLIKLKLLLELTSLVNSCQGVVGGTSASKLDAIIG